jgi:hypothetical protein
MDAATIRPSDAASLCLQDDLRDMNASDPAYSPLRLGNTFVSPWPDVDAKLFPKDDEIAWPRIRRSAVSVESHMCSSQRKMVLANEDSHEARRV